MEAAANIVVLKRAIFTEMFIYISWWPYCSVNQNEIHIITEYFGYERIKMSSGAILWEIRINWNSVSGSTNAGIIALCNQHYTALFVSASYSRGHTHTSNMKLPNLNLKRQRQDFRNLTFRSSGTMRREFGGQFYSFGSHFRGVRKESISAIEYLENKNHMCVYE